MAPLRGASRVAGPSPAFIQSMVPTGGCAARSGARMHRCVCSSAAPDYAPSHMGSGSDHAPSHTRSGSDHAPSHMGLGSDHAPSHTRSGSDHTPSHTRLGSDHTPSHTRLGSDHAPSHTRSGSDHAPSHTRLGSDHAPSHTRSGSDHTPSHTRAVALFAQAMRDPFCNSLEPRRFQLPSLCSTSTDRLRRRWVFTSSSCLYIYLMQCFIIIRFGSLWRFTLRV
ncbi:hypothetical protein APED_04905 [Acanthopleuribacter pedis]